MAKTQKQIADMLGVDKQKVYRYIKKNHIKEAYQENGRLYYDETAEKAIIHGLSKNTTSSNSNQSGSLEVVIDVLKNELEAKNQQINALNDRIADLTKALTIAQETAQAAQALHAGTIQQQLEEGSSEQKEKRGFFSRWRKKKDEV